MTKYDWAPGMPFLPEFGGGKSFPQVFSAPIDGPAPVIPMFTDDTVFSPEKKDVFQIVAILDSPEQLVRASADIAQIKAIDTLLKPSDATYIVHGEIPAASTSALSSVSILEANIIRVLGAEEYTAAGLTKAATNLIFKRPPPLLYNPNRIKKDLGFDTRYVIVRWDRFVFASCKNAQELALAAAELEKSVKNSNEHK